MELTINGKKTTLNGVRTVSELLRARGLKPTLVAIEHNGVIVPRDEFDRWEISAGDQLEIVHFVGGG